MSEVTREEFEQLKRYTLRKLKYLDGLVSDAFQKISDVEAADKELTDEAIDRAQRAERAVRRLKKEYDDHEH